MSATATKNRPKRSGAQTQHRKQRRRRPSPARVQRRLRRGDWLVQQVKSEIGAPEVQQQTLADLGLLKIGRCGLFYGDRSGAWGQIEQVQHLIAIRPLTQRPPDAQHAHEEAAEMKPVPYEVDGHKACHYRFDGDSFMSVERYDESVAINWSTALPIATVLERLDRTLLVDALNGIVFDSSIRGHREVAAEELLVDLREGRSSYPFVRLELKDMILVWQQPIYPKHVDEDFASGRLGIICPAIDEAMLTRLVEATATPLVGEKAGELVTEVATVAGGAE